MNKTAQSYQKSYLQKQHEDLCFFIEDGLGLTLDEFNFLIETNYIEIAGGYARRLKTLQDYGSLKEPDFKAVEDKKADIDMFLIGQMYVSFGEDRKTLSNFTNSTDSLQHCASVFRRKKQFIKEIKKAHSKSLTTKVNEPVFAKVDCQGRFTDKSNNFFNDIFEDRVESFENSHTENESIKFTYLKNSMYDKNNRKLSDNKNVFFKKFYSKIPKDENGSYYKIRQFQSLRSNVMSKECEIDDNYLQLGKVDKEESIVYNSNKATKNDFQFRKCNYIVPLNFINNTHLLLNNKYVFHGNYQERMDHSNINDMLSLPSVLKLDENYGLNIQLIRTCSKRKMYHNIGKILEKKALASYKKEVRFQYRDLDLNDYRIPNRKTYSPLMIDCFDFNNSRYTIRKIHRDIDKTVIETNNPLHNRDPYILNVKSERLHKPNIYRRIKKYIDYGFKIDDSINNVKDLVLSFDDIKFDVTLGYYGD